MNLLAQARGGKVEFFATAVGLDVKTSELVGKLVEFDGKNVATRLKEEVGNILAELRGRNAEIRVKNGETSDSRADKRCPEGELTAARGDLWRQECGPRHPQAKSGGVGCRPRAKPRNGVDRICGSKERQIGQVLAAMGSLFTSIRSSTAVKVKGESCGARATITSRVGRALVEKVRKVRTVGVSLDVLISGSWNRPRSYGPIEAWAQAGLKHCHWLVFLLCYLGTRCKGISRKIFLDSWRNCRSLM